MLESKKRIESLITAANETTSGSAANLTEAVQELCNGYGVGDKSLARSIIDRTITEISDETITEIGEYAFHGCKKLASINFPSVSGKLSVSAFSNCTSLKNVNLPLVTEVDMYAFVCCTKLESIDFSSTIYKIDQHAFEYCLNLKALILRSCYDFRDAVGSNLISVNAFTDTPIANGTGYVYVPRALIDVYKTETNWTVYADQIRALEDYTIDGTTTGALDESKI